MANNRNNDARERVAVGAGLAALAAGIYFFLGPDGKKHQKQMKGWMVKMKGEVLEKLEDAKEITEPVYNEIVDTVAHTNKVAGKIPQAEVAALALELKRQWRSIKQAIGGKKGGARKRSKATKNSSRRRNAASKRTKKSSS